jgi:hypothetical protein
MKTSELFMDLATSNHGSPCIQCQHCKRVHFTHECDEKELADLRAKAEKEPNKYLEDTMSDSIAWGYLDGKQYAWNCPCDSGHRYEEFIWRHRELIAEYLKRRTQENLRVAQEDAKLVASLSSSTGEG